MHNNPITSLFVCEFITAGGFNHLDLPATLVQEGLLMRDALLQDLSYLPYQISTTVDRRLPLPKNCHALNVIETHHDAWQQWQNAISKVDAVWVIAPETDGLLKKLTTLAVKQQKIILGCGLTSIEITSSKLATYHLLDKIGIATIPTYTFETWPEQSVGRWLAKPDDGAGCSETVYFANASKLMHWLSKNNKTKSHVIQPFQTGHAVSISCVMHHGTAQLLSCNEQIIETHHHQLSFHGSIVNSVCEFWDAFDHIANQIAQALPDLNGYVGVDLLVEKGVTPQKMIVVEINPRLTTSYAGLRQAIGANPAELIINTLTQAKFAWPTLQQNVVALHV